MHITRICTYKYSSCDRRNLFRTSNFSRYLGYDTDGCDYENRILDPI
jgi:hypothetical protein